MGVKIPVGYGQAVYVFALAGHVDRMVVTLGFRNVDDHLPDLCASMLHGFASAAGRPFAAGGMNNVYTFEGVDVLLGTLEGTDSGSYRSSVVGIGASTTIPPNCAMLVRKNTGHGGRQGRGRIYSPPLSINEGTVDHLGLIAPASRAAIQIDWNNWLAAMTTGGLVPYLLHDDEDVTPYQITTFNVQAQIATQRRRLR